MRIGKHRVLICGDRNWTNTTLVTTVIHALELEYGGRDNFCIIEGGATGADSIAGMVAQREGICVLECRPAWDVYGKRAGILRNQWMLLWGQPDLVVAFHNNIAQSKGTKDMVTRARAAGIEVIVATEEDI